MTQDEIIRMAREAGLTVGDNWNGVIWVCVTDKSRVPMHITLEELERFAALVAAHEREACAKVCEEFGRTINVETWDMAGKDCAAAIRARGENGTA